MIHLKRTYYLHLHFKLNKDDMTLQIMSIVFENMSLRELNNSISLYLKDLQDRDITITMADVEVENADHEHLPNSMFTALLNVPGPVTKGVIYGKED